MHGSTQTLHELQDALRERLATRVAAARAVDALHDAYHRGEDARALARETLAKLQAAADASERVATLMARASRHVAGVHIPLVATPSVERGARASRRA